ncbi:cytochrome P450 CYP5203 [Phycomyces blakesleeanus NRRL 1555(-)]|uniref:Cytochrome P450 CYP5203 n=1 Tax=Phycomyces blakesleeanus (strain ATCC 8743b / DSM 1359 / FGSC 10004 / NBRC 33097 / NRRL 1555) TaxID=763407 RepID=A0A163DJD0_PHYB8|nr:cytochrome P450 CYP5203 [Phycomyces blakesleeanus NRRL 1555(-)]OAD71650.1 cytochrome P450 CYP5203 [Phycomyces blakesleeanus NRRL 1555(-)]|eukprot:XP_018289690.1 cytochrome P450 CYP5203 [Phycomyces blakesleeanus NRRL 1555(-)]
MEVVARFVADLRKKNILSSNLSVASTAAIGVLILLALRYPDRAIFTEHREGVPHDKGLPLVGQLFSLLKNKYRIHDFQAEKFVKTMSVLGLPRGVMTIDPRNVEHVLKTNFENYVKSNWFNYCTEHLLGHGIFNANGAQWRWQRKAASLIFNVKNFRDQFTETFSVFIDEIEILCSETLDKAVVSGDAVDIHDHMFRFTLDSFVYLGFGVQLNALKTKGEVTFAASFDACQLYSFEKFMNPLIEFTSVIDRILHPRKKTMKQHIATVDQFAADVISKRRTELANGEVHTDLLSRFMSAKNENDEPLNDKELRDVVLNFIIAGRDTTAQALSWTFYCLANAPEVEEKLFKEIKDYIKDEKKMDSTELYETIKNMTYSHAVFYEVLRLYPSVPNNQKYAINDDVLPDGTKIRKGDTVSWSPYGTARSKNVWGLDAASFNPERWITPEGDLRRESQGKWSVFHGGPRVCLGQNLATLEALVAIIFLVKRYKFTMLPNQNITYETSLTHPMKNGLKVKVEKRA